MMIVSLLVTAGCGVVPGRNEGEKNTKGGLVVRFYLAGLDTDSWILLPLFPLISLHKDLVFLARTTQLYGIGLLID